MSELTIEVNERKETGSGASRRLRAAGILPAVVYGGGKQPVPIEVDRKTVAELLREGGGANTVFLLKMAGTDKSRHVMTREISIDPISRQVVHIDFQRINMSRKVRVSVAIDLQGVPYGVKTEGGMLDFINREVEVECLPGDIPAVIQLDVSAMAIGDHLEASDLVLPDGVELADDAPRVIVAVAHSRVAAEVEEAEAEAEAEVEALIEAEREEPEVIGRGREAGEEESAEEAG
jgi:large subunit ribosomal protein L25